MLAKEGKSEGPRRCRAADAYSTRRGDDVPEQGRSALDVPEGAYVLERRQEWEVLGDFLGESEGGGEGTIVVTSASSGCRADAGCATGKSRRSAYSNVTH